MFEITVTYFYYGSRYARIRRQHAADLQQREVQLYRN